MSSTGSSAAGGAPAAPAPTPLELAEPALEFSEAQTETWGAEAHVFSLYQAADKLLNWYFSVRHTLETDREFSEQMTELRSQFKYWGGKRWPLGGARATVSRDDARNKAVERWLREAGCSSEQAINALVYEEGDAAAGNTLLASAELFTAFAAVGEMLFLLAEDGSRRVDSVGDLRGNVQIICMEAPKFLTRNPGPEVQAKLARLKPTLARITSADSADGAHIEEPELRAMTALFAGLTSDVKRAIRGGV